MSDKIKNVKVVEGCIACHTCEGICPQIFQVNGSSKVVGDEFKKYYEKIIEAEQMCPVQVIKVERLEQSTKPRLTFNSKLVKTRPLTADVFGFDFLMPNFTFTPGQFVTIGMRDGEGDFIRAYSIAGYRDNILSLCIKINEQGRGGQYLKALAENDPVFISAARGTFTLKNTIKHKLLVATGTGLAPMLAMLDVIPEEVPKTMLMGVRAEGDIFYHEKLQQYPNTRLIYTVSRPSDTYQGDKGRVTDYFKQIDMIDDTTEVYICGNKPMVDSVIKHFTAINYPSDLIYHEKFAPATAPAAVSTAEKGTADNSKNSDGEKTTGLIGLIKAVIIDGDIPYFEWLQRAVLYSSIAVITGFPFFYTDYVNLGKFGFNLLAFVLMIRPIAQILPDFGILRRIVSMRRQMGILAATLMFTHAYGFFLSKHLDVYQTINDISFWNFSQHFTWASIGFIAGMIGLITSNMFSTRVLGKLWKVVQKSSYVFFFAGIIHIALVVPEKAPDYLIMGAELIVLWFLVKMNLKLTFIKK